VVYGRVGGVAIGPPAAGAWRREAGPAMKTRQLAEAKEKGNTG
jgi:hypothetical protein